MLPKPKDRQRGDWVINNTYFRCSCRALPVLPYRNTGSPVITSIFKPLVVQRLSRLNRVEQVKWPSSWCPPIDRAIIGSKTHNRISLFRRLQSEEYLQRYICSGFSKEIACLMLTYEIRSRYRRRADSFGICL